MSGDLVPNTLDSNLVAARYDLRYNCAQLRRRPIVNAGDDDFPGFRIGLDAIAISAIAPVDHSGEDDESSLADADRRKRYITLRIRSIGARIPIAEVRRVVCIDSDLIAHNLKPSDNIRPACAWRWAFIAPLEGV